MGPFDQLMTQPSGSNVAPETLEMLGRQASQMFQSQGIPLNQAVQQVLANHPELGNEHINRIVEFANTVTFQEMFQNSEDKNVHFDVAEPGVVLRDLKDGGTPSHDGKTLSDYQRSPQQAQPDQALNQAFDAQFLGGSSGSDGQMKVAGSLREFGHSAKKNGKTLGMVAAAGGAAYAGARGVKRLIDGKEKTASDLREEIYTDHEKHANPLDDAYDAKVRLQATREHLTQSYETMHGLLKEAQETFFQQVKLQVMDPEGAGLGGVIGALEKMAEPELIEVLLTDATQRLVKEGFQQPYLNDSLKKTAGVIPNLEHPLFASVDSILKLASELVTCDSALHEVEKMLAATEIVFKTAGALTTAVKKTIDHQGSVPAGIRQRFPRA